MTLEHFNALSQGTQRKLVFHKGVYLTCRSTLDFSVQLFQLDGFYVELYAETKSREIVWIKSFEHTEPLLPYLEDIDLTELIN